MNNNILAGIGITAAFAAKAEYDESIRRSKEQTDRIIEAIEKSKIVKPVEVEVEKEYVPERPAWPFT